MTSKERIQKALQLLIDLDQESLSVSVIGDYTQDECYNEARVWLERALDRSQDD